jgi:DNA topoisomerase-1
MSNLVIVESPAKAETIEKYLPGDFNVKASFGHVRDLPDNKSQLPEEYKEESWAKLGVDIEHDFDPVYVVNDSQSKNALKKLRSALDDAEALYLATDEDREGEAISWHLIEELHPEQPTYRMVFHEITKDAIERALDEPRDIDDGLVEAQEARRILDRLVGYPLSLLVAKKIKYGLSAGRVQSPAVRLLVERERQRRRFTVGTYWDLKGQLDRKGNQFEADLRSIDGTRLAAGRDFDRDTGKIPDDKDVMLLGEEEATELQEKLEGKTWTVKDVNERDYTSSPKPPFITSTLQQEASRKLGMSAGQTMGIAQMLYENGHITYMRTDSVNLSEQAVNASRKAASKNFGSDYVSDGERHYKSSSNVAQEAHEAIRPTGDTFTHPDNIDVRGRAKKLYELIWQRTVACQMADAQKTSIRVDMNVEVDGSELVFRANGTRVNFAGFIAAYLDDSDNPEAVLNSKETSIPDVDTGDTVECTDIDTVKHETKPPARYTEASLVEALEDEGVGRPSTYATIMEKLKRDGRYAKPSGKSLVPTYVAFAVTQLLEDHFPNLVDLQFTAHMEEDLDEIARGEGSKVDYLDRFYRREGGFAEQIEQGEEQINPEEARIVRLEDFDATLRVGRYGPYAEIEHDGEVKTIDVPEDIPPADLEYEEVLERLKEREKGPESLGEHPDTGDPVYLMNGRYGHYLQLGEREEDSNPKTASIPDSMDPEEVTLEDALELLELPIQLGEHPDSGKPVEASIGPYGPYVRHKNNYESLDSEEEVFTIELDEALSKLSSENKNNKNVLKELGEDPDSGEQLNVLNGRYGPYVNLGNTNASIPSELDPKEVTKEKALELIEEKRAG